MRPSEGQLGPLTTTYACCKCRAYVTCARQGLRNAAAYYCDLKLRSSGDVCLKIDVIVV